MPYACRHDYRRVAVIAGVGSRGYYRKLGYELDEGDGQFMIKDLSFFSPGWYVVSHTLVSNKLVRSKYAISK